MVRGGGEVKKNPTPQEKLSKKLLDGKHPKTGGRVGRVPPTKKP